MLVRDALQGGKGSREASLERLGLDVRDPIVRREWAFLLPFPGFLLEASLPSCTHKWRQLCQVDTLLHKIML